MDLAVSIALGIFVAFWLILGTMMAVDHYRDVKRCQAHLRAHQRARIFCDECWRCWGVLHEGQG